MKKLIVALGLASGVFGAESWAQEWRQTWERKSWEVWRAKPEAEVRKLAEAGDRVAIWVLWSRLYDGRTAAEAQPWLKKAIELELPQAIAWEAGIWQQDDLEMCLRKLEKAAATGYPLAMLELGRILLGPKIDEKGFLSRPDPGRAVELLQKAADEHSTDAMAELAVLYACGVGEPRHAEERPMALWLKIANHGNREAMREVAQRLRAGYGIEKDLQVAAAWAARGRFDWIAVVESGRGGGRIPGATEWISEGGQGDEEVLKEISNLFEKAVAERSGAAALELARMFEKGTHGKAIPARAAAMYALAEKFGQAGAGAKRAALEATLDETGRQVFQREVEWMTRASGR